MQPRLRLLFAAVAALAAAPLSAVAAPSIAIVSDITPKSGTTSDRYVFTVEITISGINGYDKFFPPRFSDFSTADASTRQSTQWLYDPSRGQEIKNVEIRRYVLVPRRAGKLKVEEAMIRVGSQDFQTKPLVVQVQDVGGGITPPGSVGPGPSQPLPTATTNPDLFIEATVDKKDVVVGEQLVATWKLYMAADELKNYRTTVEPQTEGFWVEELAQPTHFTYQDERRGGRHYTTAIVLKKAVFPLRTGQLMVGALEAELETFGGVAAMGEVVRSAPLIVQVNPAPDKGKPTGFEPPNVGTFTINADASPIETTSGEPVLLRVTVEGTGNVRGIKIPDISDLGTSMKDFRVFSPKLKESVKLDGDIVGGTRSYEIRLVPTKNGAFEIPELQLVYWDPSETQYEIAKTKPISLSISGVAPAALVTPANPDDPNADKVQTAPRIHGQVYRSDLSSRQSLGFHRQPLFWLLLFGPPLAYVALIAADKVRERMQRETPRARLRRAAGRAKKAMRICELHIRGERPAKFFGELSRALTDHLEDRLGVPVAGMTRDQVRALLSERGFPEATLEALVRELENCDFARFAPSASGPGEMRAAMRRAKTLLGEIERAHLKDDDEPSEDPRLAHS